MQVQQGDSNEYRKVKKISDARKLCCTLSKIQTSGYFVKNGEME